MFYVPFFEFFPEIAENETRVLTNLSDDSLPKGEFGYLESFCNEPGCDCRRVFLNVTNARDGKLMAVIAYGWEKKQFYVDWFGDNDPQMISELKGPALNMASPQSKYAPAFLQFFKEVLLKDKAYIKRIVRHYEMFRDYVEKNPEKMESLTPYENPEKTGRNEPCPCGSGKTFKKCCA